MIQKIKYLFKKYILRKTTVLDILLYANKHHWTGLCFSFENACEHYNVEYSMFKDKCVQFNKAEAIKHFGAVKDAWWWPQCIWDTGRQRFLDYLIDYYSKQPPIFI